MILERGYENISTRDVADLAGCNHGLITQYFGTKSALFTKVPHRLATEIGAAISAGTPTVEAMVRRASLPSGPLLWNWWHERPETGRSCHQINHGVCRLGADGLISGRAG